MSDFHRCIECAYFGTMHVIGIGWVPICVSPDAPADADHEIIHPEKRNRCPHFKEKRI